MLQEAPYAFGSTYEREGGFDESTWRRNVVSRTRFVVEVDGETAGSVSGGPADAPGTAAITAMWVDPRFRRRGIGDLLVRRALQWAHAQDYVDVVLWVTEVNAEAERLYKRNGFRRTGAVSKVRAGEDAVEYEMSVSLLS